MDENIVDSQAEGIICPNCGSTNVTVQLFREDAGTTKISKTRSKSKFGGHGLIWWLLIGWWWWIIDLFLWICYFPIRLLIQIFKPKHKRSKSSTHEQSINHTSYNTVCLCNDCGSNWIKSQSFSGLGEWDAKKNMKSLKSSVR